MQTGSRILHVTLLLQGADQVELRFFWDNPLEYQRQYRSLSVIQQEMQRSEERYYTRFPEDYAQTGQHLYHWLDGPERRLQQALDQHPRDARVLAISAAEGLAHLPWEVLHDGQRFLVEQRIVPVRWVQGAKAGALRCQPDPQNRALHVLFMATSPRGEQDLDFEKEEGAILATTKGKAYLRVEESGCLQELKEVRQEYEPDFFDVAHLSGHAGWDREADQPYFLTETVYGDPEYSGAEDLSEALWCEAFPNLIFLSGCRTGYASGNGSLPSLAQRLLEEGAKAVLGWGQRVLDLEATTGAERLYEELSNGSPLWAALAATYRSMIQVQARDWHHLRLYVGDTLPGALVTRRNTKGRQPIPVQTQTGSGFRDDQGKLRVATREEFVGRRRQLQNCLRALKKDPDKIGIVIHGMGGLGKSTIASRLWDRLPEHQKLCWWRQIDEGALTTELIKKLSKPDQQQLRDYLRDPGVPLSARLIHIFQSLSQAGERPFLLVLDDFEWNLDPVQGHYVLQPQVVAVLEALVSAIRETTVDHRILITCRYKFESELNGYFYFQGLDPLQGSDLQKKLKRLPRFQSEDLDRELIDRALKLADGNPRLLEWLDQDVLGQPDAADQLSRLESSSDLWKEKIIWKELYDLIDDSLRQILSRCLVYEIPVPMQALEGVCDQIPDHQALLQRAIELSLLEVSEDNQNYRVSRVLPRILTHVCLPEDPDELYCKALGQLRLLGWDREENENGAQWLELFRVWFADRRDPERFRQGFSHMISIQDHEPSDRALERVLRGCREDLTSEGLCSRLETLLAQREWKAADEETAWIFYQVMVIEGLSSDWREVIEQIPLPILQEIDRLWSEAREEGQFGFSKQKEIFIQAGGTPGQGYDKTVWDTFGDAVQWRQSGSWLRYSQIRWDQDAIQQAPSGHLPLLCILRYPVGADVGSFLWLWGGVSLLSSRPIETSP